MKINEVEALVGITKKNIRFYEEQGLLTPRRNVENGYREYGEEDVKVLKQIKLLRKLGVSLDEIRLMQNGTHTLGDGMRRHLVSLEREKQNVEQSIRLCQELRGEEVPLSALNTKVILERMEELEKEGTSFQNMHKQDVRIRYIAPIVVTILTIGLITALCVFLFWACQEAPQDAPPAWFLGIVVMTFLSVGVGVVLALTQRIREIGKGEIDDARYY